jgi:teichuronic acid biosynthesis glycosyltransferase TuaH
MTPQTIIYLAGSRWSDVPGTDRRLVTALAASTPVLWVDPPYSIATRGRSEPAGTDTVSPGVTRLRILGPPGSSRPGIRMLSHTVRARALRRAIKGIDIAAIVVASPRERFPRRIAGTRFLYVTDDWVAGADLMGLSARQITADLALNIAETDRVAAVSPVLAEQLQHDFGAIVEVLANGCAPVPPTTGPTRRSTSAVLVGQLNERIDAVLLEAVRDGGTSLVVIGPRTDRAADTGAAFDRLLRSDGVSWLGELPPEELPARLEQAGVGLTPYTDTAFNRASFPLKTLEYLASGLPVVSTDMPSVRWLDTDLIEVASGPADFAAKVREVLARPADAHDRERRIAFAGSHSWQARAAQLLAMLSAAGGPASRR